MIKIRHSPTDEKYQTKTYGKGWDILWKFLRRMESGQEVREAVEQLKYLGSTPTSDSCHAVKKGNLVNLIDTCTRYKDFYLPYDQFIDLLAQWKLVLEQQQNKNAYDHDYKQLIVFADDEYNLTITVDDRMIEEHKQT